MRCSLALDVKLFLDFDLIKHAEPTAFFRRSEAMYRKYFGMKGIACSEQLPGHTTHRSLQAKVARQSSVPWSRTSMTGATPYLCRWIFGGMQSFRWVIQAPACPKTIASRWMLHKMPSWNEILKLQHSVWNVENTRPTLPAICPGYVARQINWTPVAIGAACYSWQQCISTQDAICYSPLPAPGICVHGYSC